MKNLLSPFDLFPYRLMRTDFSTCSSMKTDIKEKDDYYQLLIEIPGAKKEDIKIELNDHDLIVSVEKENSKKEEDKNGKVIYQERSLGSQSRSFYLDETCRPEDIKAMFENGLLKITLPKQSKKEIEEKKYITIEG